MAFKIDLTKAHPWPATLGRPLDKDGAFRFATLLAAMRVIAPMMPGDGFERHFEDATYPPDFAAADKYAVDAYRAMAALFAWDGGQSTVLHTDDVGTTFSPVTPGTHVFVDILERSSEFISLNPYNVEMGAVRNEVNSCLASAFPYRYWWQAFNRAMYHLMRAWPYGSFTVTVYRYSAEEDDMEIEEATLNLYPYVLSEAPDGSVSKTIDELLTDWMSHDDASTYRAVIPNEPWLMTAEDVDFSGVFRNIDDEGRAHALRSLWNTYARNVGFYNYADTSAGYEPGRWSYKSGLANYWLGKTEVRYAKDPDNRLAQLSGDWYGHTEVWRDEFPYHGFAAMQAYLNYFEKKNLGFVVATGGYRVSDPDDIDSSHTVYDQPFEVSHRKIRNVRTFDTGDILTGLSLSNTEVTIDVTDMIKETEPKQYIDYYDATPEARTELGAPEASAARGSLGGITDNIRIGTSIWEPSTQKWSFMVDGDGDFFAAYLDGETPLDFVAYTKAKLESLLQEKITKYEEDPSSVGATSEASVAVPNVGGGDIRGERLAFGFTSSENEDEAPYFRGAASDDNKIYFLKTTGSSRIARASNHGLFDRLRAEADVPATDQLEPLGIGDGKITATFRLIRRDVFDVREVEGSTMTIYDYRDGKTDAFEVPLIQIFFNKSHETNPEPDYPPVIVNPDDMYYADVVFRGSFGVGDIECEISDENSYDTRSTYSRLEILRQMQFVRYPERVIYPQ